MDISPEILDFYAQGHEHERLTSRPSLELIRTRVLLDRYLPGAPGRVLDVGGGSGVHASWLAEKGYDVHLIDPAPLHVEQASTRGGFRASIGDARDLQEPDSSYDIVLLLGPLYHLVDRNDRLRALREAHRVTRSGGIVIVVAISRYASTFDGYFRNYVDEQGFPAHMLEDLTTGQHRNPGGHVERFTTAYFHDTDDFRAEMTETGLRVDALVPIEGVLHWAPMIRQRVADPAQLPVVLAALAAMETDPAMTGATAHLLAACGVAKT
jgi:ubiquinone/menaquinone biosynthesis C-methylase UbiE